MSSYQHPGIYIQEIPAAQDITGASTSTTAFIGCLARGPIDQPTLCTSMADVERLFGPVDAAFPTSLQLSQFFINGGAIAYVVRIATSGDIANGLAALETVQDVNLICAPDMAALDPAAHETVTTSMLNHASKYSRFALIDLPSTIQIVTQAVDWGTNVLPTLGPNISYGATYFPNLIVTPPSGGNPVTIAPCGTLAGIYTTTDQNVGVWKAPAGVSAALAGITGLSCPVTDQEQGLLNPLGVNALRTFTGYGPVVWGARTLASARETDWTYISVRRLILYIEQSLRQSLQWVVFAPNDATLWSQVRSLVSNFLQNLYLQGALLGATADQAFFVRCDTSTMTAGDIAAGNLNIEIDIAAERPAELIAIVMQQKTMAAA